MLCLLEEAQQTKGGIFVMKKAKMIGKKALSVFLAVLMVLTAWVWVAPTEASAVNAGTYNVRFSVNVTDKADSRSPIESSYWEIKYRDFKYVIKDQYR